MKVLAKALLASVALATSIMILAVVIATLLFRNAPPADKVTVTWSRGTSRNGTPFGFFIVSNGYPWRVRFEASMPQEKMPNDWQVVFGRLAPVVLDPHATSTLLVKNPGQSRWRTEVNGKRVPGLPFRISQLLWKAEALAGLPRYPNPVHVNAPFETSAQSPPTIPRHAE